MSTSAASASNVRVPALTLGWAAGLAFVLLGINVAEFWSRRQVLHEPLTLPGAALDTVIAVLAVSILAACLLQRHWPSARRLLEFSLASALALFLAGTLWFAIVFGISIAQGGLSMWRFFVPAIGLLGLLSAWPFLLWRRLRRSEEAAAFLHATS